MDKKMIGLVCVLVCSALVDAGGYLGRGGGHRDKGPIRPVKPVYPKDPLGPIIDPIGPIIEPFPVDPIGPVNPRGCGPVCEIFCPFGNVLDKRGCPTCRCKEEPISQKKLLPPKRCGPICRMFCPNGFVEDINGCPICKCKPFGPQKPLIKPPVVKPPVVKPPMCGPVCAIFCEFGNVMDSRGCPTCQCKKDPSPFPVLRCPRGSFPEVPRRSCGRRSIFSRLPISSCGKSSFCHQRGGRRSTGICCRRKLGLPTTGKCPRQPQVWCIRHHDQCQSDLDCKFGRSCCPGACGLECKRIRSRPYIPRLN